MPHTFKPFQKNSSISFDTFFGPIEEAIKGMPPYTSGCNVPLKFTIDHYLKTLVFYHLQEHTSAQHLLQVLEQDDYARENIAPPGGIKKSTLSETINSKGLEQFLYVFNQLQLHASGILSPRFSELGNIVAIDGSLIDAVFSMAWADYRKGAKKAKVHMGLDVNRSIPGKLFLTDGKAGERPFVSQILSSGETGVMDRGYQSHELFDKWQEEGILFVCRIKAGTRRTIIEKLDIDPESCVFFDGIVHLGTPGVNQTKKTLRLVGYEINKVKYQVTTDRYDLTAEQIALIYKLRWDVEKFFAWWKRHLKVYHLIARSEHGLMVQILAGLITYLLLAIYCHKQHNEHVSIKRLRELRIRIQNELRNPEKIKTNVKDQKETEP